MTLVAEKKMRFLVKGFLLMKKTGSSFCNLAFYFGLQ